MIFSAKILSQRKRGKKSELYIFILTFLSANYDSSFSLPSFIEPGVIVLCFILKKLSSRVEMCTILTMGKKINVSGSVMAAVSVWWLVVLSGSSGTFISGEEAIGSPLRVAQCRAQCLQTVSRNRVTNNCCAWGVLRAQKLCDCNSGFARY